MKNSVFFIYLLILAGSTYLIRVIPFIAIKEKINNSFVRSFLYYIPYAVLTAMTIPAVFYATNWWVGAAAGLSALISLSGRMLPSIAPISVPTAQPMYGRVDSPAKKLLLTESSWLATAKISSVIIKPSIHLEIPLNLESAF